MFLERSTYRIIGSLTVLMFGLVTNSATFAVEETLQNDGFTSGAPVDFQGGFVPGEVAAARFVPQIICPCVVTKVTVLFGGANGVRNVGISVWEDAAGAALPGTLVSTSDVMLVGANSSLNEIDLSLSPVIVNGPFRIGLEFGQAGLPSVATDADGTINASANFILADVAGMLVWFQSSTFGVTGDFIIRATIDNQAPIDTDGDGDPDVTDPDDDNDGIEDALDTEPLVASNLCTTSDGDNAAIGVSVVGDLTCAAQVSIDVQGATQVMGPPAHLRLISPTILFKSGFSVLQGGQLTVISADPCSGCSP